MVSNAPIGVLDSGIGGLTVVKELMAALPQESLIYFGDTARVPYGPRPHEEIQRFTFQILDYLSAFHIKLAVMACNTMTMWVYDAACQRYPFPIVGMDLAAQAAVQATRRGKIGVIATVATIASGKHQAAIKAIAPDVSVYPQACPPFAALIEQGHLQGPDIEAAAQEYLTPLKEAGVDTVVLACTHYPYITPLLRRILGADVTLIDPARETAQRAKSLLAARDLLADGSQRSYRFCFSAAAQRAQQLAQALLPGELPVFETVPLGE